MPGSRPPALIPDASGLVACALPATRSFLCVRCRSLVPRFLCLNSTHGRGGEDIGIDHRSLFGSGVKLGVSYWGLGSRQEKACSSTPQNRRFLMARAVDGSILDNLDRGNFTLRSSLFRVLALGAKEDFPKSTWMASASDDGASL